MMSSMLSIRKFFPSKLRSSAVKEDHHGKDNKKGSKIRTAISEEYREAFRTKSYTEICDKIKGQLETRIPLDDVDSISSSSSYIHLSEYLVELRQETLASISESSKYHHFLTNYFDVSLEATQIYELILLNVHQVRLDYHEIKNVMEFVEQKPDYKSWSHSQIKCAYKTLKSFTLHANPFSTTTPEKFQQLHDTHKSLLHELNSKPKKKKRFLLFMKRALAILGCGALAIALILLAMHSMVAAPGLIAIIIVYLVMLVVKREAKKKQKAGLDAAAKGIYVVMKDLDMMSRVVQSLMDEMEHRKVAAEVCVQGKINGVLKRVAREFKTHECGFLGELEELEKQIYLCFLHINRSRRLLIQQFHT